MLYRAIGLMSGSSLDGLDLVFAEFLHEGGRWSFEIKAADCYPYNEDWRQQLQKATALSALDYQLLHTAYGHYLGREVNRFIEANSLHYQAALVASHGHTTFHLPAQQMTAQLGDGASIAAETHLPVVSGLRAMDVAFGGQGAPIVPVGEELLLPDYGLFLNLGGIANISIHAADGFRAFDICPANRVLNDLAADAGKDYDDGGSLSATGTVNTELLEKLNALSYYALPAPKSLANSFGTEEILPLIRSFNLSAADALRTYIEHIATQIEKAAHLNTLPENRRLLVTGGGAFNTFLVERLTQVLSNQGIELVVPDAQLVQYKEALIMALLGVLRWREESTVKASVTGASRDSIGGAVWIGQEA